MRLSSILIRLGVFAVAALIAGLAARAAVYEVENRSVIAVQEALIDQGHDWATVQGDGLQVILEGQAPSEATRFRSISIAGSVVDASRVIDNMSVKDVDGLTPPIFSIEILRNDSGVSLIGLIPAATDRDALARQIEAIAEGLPVTDLLDAADFPAPDNWRPAMNYAMRALAQLPRSKISVTAGSVVINAIADGPAEKRRLESELARLTPAGISAAVTVSAPRPVITPFTTRFSIEDGVVRLDACAADAEETLQQIVTATVAAGYQGKVNCSLGLGMPSPDWGDAVVKSIGAIRALGGGSVTLTDADIALVAAEGTPQALFDQVVGELGNALPDFFVLTATLPVAPSPTADEPPQFSATLSPEGIVQLRGKVTDDLMNETVESYAKARFGQANITMGTLVADGLPQGWAVRVLAGIEALSKLSNGSVVVRPELIEIRGNTGNAQAGSQISGLLVENLGQGQDFRIDVNYVEKLDPVAGIPTPEECVAEIETVTTDRKILFDPGSATITADTQPVVDDIAEILRQCADLKIKIAGYTDSQGREEMNLQLSQQRAEAVLTALRSRRVPVGSFEAVGYGEADPIADNETEAGREANRRIEFSLIVPEAIPEETTALEEIESETRGDAETAPEQPIPSVIDQIITEGTADQIPAGADTEQGSGD
jgi:OOP family OmpA-OmpF porin